MNALDTRVISNPADMALLAPDWWELWRRCPSATPFQSPAWLLPWWQAFAPGEPFVAIVRKAGQLVGLAPFYIETSARGRRLLPIGISVSDYLDVLIDPAVAESAGCALVTCMAAEGHTCNIWEFPELQPDSMTLRLPCPADCEDIEGLASACPVLMFDRTAHAFRDSVPARRRRKLRLALNRAARRGAVLIDRCQPASGPAMLEHLFRLHRARWASRGEPGVLDDPRVRRFHRQALPLLLEADLLRLYAVRIAGETAAIYYGFLHRERALAYLIGFDPAFAFESPGTILVGHAIEEAIREGAREFHFLRGQETYKYEWGEQDRANKYRMFRRIEHYARAS